MTPDFSLYRSASRICSGLLVMAIIFWTLILSGCVAQQADLARVQKDLEDQIKLLNQEKQELKTIISQNREEAETLREQQNADMKDLFRARAEIRQQLKAVREADLTKLSGEDEEINFRLTKIRQDLDAQTSQANSRFQAIETQIDEQGTSISTNEAGISSNQGQLTTLVQQIDQDSQTRNEQHTEFQTSLSSFKESMAGLGANLVEETERANQATTDLRHELTQKIDELSTSMTSLESQQSTLQAEVQTQTTNIQEVSDSITQIRGAMEQSGTLVGGQITDLEANLEQLEIHVNSLTDKLNTDTQALQTYLEQDVKSSMNSLAENMASQQRPLIARLDTAEGHLEGLDAQTQSNATQVQELTQAVVALKEKQDFVGGLLGERGDKFMQESGRLTERLNLLETHQSDLTQKVDTNTQSTARHLAEVNTSIASVTQALENTSGALVTRLDTQEQQLNGLSSKLQEFEQAKAHLEANLSTIQSTSQNYDDMRQALEQITARLQELEVHQSGLVGKLDADGQTMNTHLAEVNTGIQSVADALEQAEGRLRSRIDEQDQKLNQAMTAFQSAQAMAETSEANLTHLNQLTQTINQLRDVVNTIGTKLGGRVDLHESRLAELAKRVNLLSSRGKKKK